MLENNFFASRKIYSCFNDMFYKLEVCVRCIICFEIQVVEKVTAETPHNKYAKYKKLLASLNQNHNNVQTGKPCLFQRSATKITWGV